MRAGDLGKISVRIYGNRAQPGTFCVTPLRPFHPSDAGDVSQRSPEFDSRLIHSSFSSRCHGPVLCGNFPPHFFLHSAVVPCVPSWSAIHSGMLTLGEFGTLDGDTQMWDLPVAQLVRYILALTLNQP